MEEEMKKAFQFYVQQKKCPEYPKKSVKTLRCLAIRLFLPIIGFLALIWFLIRVIPKPSRAGYPCQRIAFPLASGFVLWLAGLLGSLVFIRKAHRHLAGSRYRLAALCICVSVLCLWLTLSATSSRTVKAADPVPNNPIGTAKGIFPGRVVWIHDPNATDWGGPGVSGNYFWQPAHTIQKYVDAMVSKSLRNLSGEQTDADAWDALFRYFNNQHDKGDVGYTAGEKIVIKANMVTCNFLNYSVNSAYNKTNYLDRPDTSPQILLSMLRQLVYKTGVDPVNIAVGDTLCDFPNQWRDYLIGEFPTIIIFDYRGTSGRIKSVPSAVRQYWSTSAASAYPNDYVPALYAQAEYLINMAVLKSHSAGITLCAKNHWGSFNRRPDNASYYNLHLSIAGSTGNTLPGQYRAQVDAMGHPDVGGKTLLYMIDGLYGGQNWNAYPYKFQMAPFNNDWPSSVFASLDPVAIDSVGLDILWEEWPTAVRIGGVDDYLFEAAQADNPPSGTYYDPDGDGVALQSLGVHERWNNAADRQYSRNLGTGDGIELVYYKMQHDPADLNDDLFVNLYDFMYISDQWLWTGTAGSILEDLMPDGTVDLDDLQILTDDWLVPQE